MRGKSKGKKKEPKCKLSTEILGRRRSGAFGSQAGGTEDKKDTSKGSSSQT